MSLKRQRRTHAIGKMLREWNVVQAMKRQAKREREEFFTQWLKQDEQGKQSEQVSSRRNLR